LISHRFGNLLGAPFAAIWLSLKICHNADNFHIDCAEFSWIFAYLSK